MKQLSEQMGTCPECGYVGSIGYTQGKHVPTGSQCLQRQLGNQCIENTKLREQLTDMDQRRADWQMNYEIILTACLEAETRAAIGSHALQIVIDHICEIDGLCDDHVADDYCEEHCQDGLVACLKHWAEQQILQENKR